MGLDSLLLTQASQLVSDANSVCQISFRQLMEELSSTRRHRLSSGCRLAARSLRSGPPRRPVPASVACLPRPSSRPGVSRNGILEQLLLQQQQLTNQLLQVLGRQPIGSAPSASPVAKPPVNSSSPGCGEQIARAVQADPARQSIRPSRRSNATALEALIARYTQTHRGSKKLAAENRPILADPRSVSGFKQLWKEMVYPIFTTRSDGSRVWDVDGNEYVDFVMGFGASLFGHRPPFVVQAIHEQLDRGFEIGPIQPLAGEVAALIREFTGMQRSASPIPVQKRCWRQPGFPEPSPAATRSRCLPAPTTASLTRCCSAH